MDSMVGYKTPRYLRFGWCGARLDDLMNYPAARATWLLIAAIAAMLPSCSGWKALRVGFRQHAVLLGPNSGWSEAATAGGIVLTRGLDSCDVGRLVTPGRPHGEGRETSRAIERHLDMRVFQAVVRDSTRQWRKHERLHPRGSRAGGSRSTASSPPAADPS